MLDCFPPQSVEALASVTSLLFHTNTSSYLGLPMCQALCMGFENTASPNLHTSSSREVLLVTTASSR